MIAVYIVSFTILITSVIKVTGTFITLDKNLENKRAQFIQKTRSLHYNQSGSITLMAVLLTLMISALLMFFTLKNKVELKEARYRKDSYLCFKYLNVETENYIKDISHFNIALRTSYAAQFAPIPAAAAAARALFQASIVARNTRHFYYIKNLVKNDYCKDSLESLSYLKNLPFITNLTFSLQTNIDQTTQIKAHQWTVTYYKYPNGIRLKNSFCLNAQMQVEDPFFPNYKIKTSELVMTGFSKLKCSSGFH